MKISMESAKCQRNFLYIADIYSDFTFQATIYLLGVLPTLYLFLQIVIVFLAYITGGSL